MSLPPNIFSEKHQMIFIHIPKTGGSAIKKYLFNDIMGGHVSMKHIPQEYHKYNSVAFVRNPYLRVLSAYNYLKKGGCQNINDLNYKMVIDRYSSFDDFVIRALETYYMEMEHFIPQYYFTHFLGNKLVKTICKYENFDEEVFKLFNVKLDIINPTEDYEKDILKVYNENTYQVINRIYREDFACFDYLIKKTPCNILRDFFYSSDLNYLNDILNIKLSQGDEKIFVPALHLGQKDTIIQILKKSPKTYENYYKMIRIHSYLTDEDYFKNRDNTYFYMRSKNKDLTNFEHNIPQDYQMFFKALNLTNKEELEKSFQDIIEYLKVNNYKDDFNYFVLNPYYYYLSYININLKDIFKLISQIFRLKNPIYNRVNEDNLKLKKINKIKIAFFAGRIREISSVFFDRFQTIMKLPDTIYDKYLLVNGGLDEKSKQILGFSEFIKCFKGIYEIDLVKGVDFVFSQNYDIIVFPDIGMISPTVLYAHLRSAPLQITTWGHSKTSGIDTIDYYFSSEVYEIEEAQDHYSEKLIKFKGLGTTYPFKIFDKESLFKIKELSGKFVIGCLCTFIKFNDEFVSFLKRFEEYTNIIFLVLENEKLKHLKNVFTVPVAILQTFFNYIHNCHFIIDIYPFGSCNLALESFLMGKVVLYYPSEFLSGRYVKGFYKKMEIEDEILESYNYDDYYEKIIKMSKDKKLRKKLEKKIIKKRDVLFNEKLNLEEWHHNLTSLLEKTGLREFSDELKENIKNCVFDDNFISL